MNEESTGYFQCTAENDIGTDTELIRINVMTIGPTGVNITGPNQVEVGGTIELRCFIIGETPRPAATIRWYFNGRAMSYGERFRYDNNWVYAKDKHKRTFLYL